ncbi:hypothetical protein CORC01_08868 [Colletotrichum orchidophilum]|uniref:Ribosomal protein s17 n=1 Tax=Colletotrichum orchidophilum TaxID=1209926 RepID=A0A1G4B392_9PEZI|nr:uncharacterized protein CORC01_08868 [Colletotrichum orchidophilum]OHE95871.1 hypothetical protein CORC01_08868 [Colletotrichum orchidophilum]
MQIQKLITALVGLAVVAEASVTFLDSSPLSAALAKRQQRAGNRATAKTGGNASNGNANNGQNGALCLQANAVQKGSQQPGKPSAQQANSKTDNANFINVCSGSTLTDGEQKTGGSCNGIPMGKIPAQTKMVSTVITNPPHNGNIQANKDFDVQLNIQNLQAGSFTDAQSTYYSAPQDLSAEGIIVGHVHVTIQDMGNTLTPSSPLDPTKFAFFKGINDNGNGKGTLKATVTGGLPAGVYRLCTMSSASNHQPVLMPVAQRGGQDDCNKFTVTANGGANGGGGANNANNGGNAANKGGNNGGQQNNNAGAAQGNKQNGSKKGAGAGQGNAQATPQNTPQGFPNTQFPGQFPQFPGSAPPGQTTSQSQTGSAQGTPNANSSGQEGDAASNSKNETATPAVDPAAATTTQGGGASKNGNTNGSGQNGNGNSSGSGKGGATSNAIGGIAAPAVSDSGDSSRPFSVNGNSFVSKANAAQRACDVQRNACFNAFNGGKLNGATTADCDAQVQTCIQELS